MNDHAAALRHLREITVGPDACETLEIRRLVAGSRPGHSRNQQALREMPACKPVHHARRQPAVRRHSRSLRPCRGRGTAARRGAPATRGCRVQNSSGYQCRPISMPAGYRHRLHRKRSRNSRVPAANRSTRRRAVGQRKLIFRPHPGFSSAEMYLALVPKTVTSSASAICHRMRPSLKNGEPSNKTSVAPVASPLTSQFHIIQPQVVK